MTLFELIKLPNVKSTNKNANGKSTKTEFNLSYEMALGKTTTTLNESSKNHNITN